MYQNAAVRDVFLLICSAIAAYVDSRQQRNPSGVTRRLSSPGKEQSDRRTASWQSRIGDRANAELPYRGLKVISSPTHEGSSMRCSGSASSTSVMTSPVFGSSK